MSAASLPICLESNLGCLSDSSIQLFPDVAIFRMAGCLVCGVWFRFRSKSVSWVRCSQEIVKKADCRPCIFVLPIQRQKHAQ